MRRRSLRLVAGLAVATALVGGCASKHEANDTLPSASEKSASPTLQPLGPSDLPMPADARVQTAPGAQAFVRYYMALYSAAQKSLDPQFMRELSSGCETCDRLADELENSAQEGYEYRGGDIRVDGMGQPAVENAEAQLAFAITQAALTIYKDGQPVSGLAFPDRPSPSCGAILHWDNARATWVFAQWDVG